MSIAFPGEKNYIYFQNDGIISRLDLVEKKFEVRNFKTSEWRTTSDNHLIAKMFEKKGIVPEKDAENLFLLLKARAFGK
jgi:hypothetical protein